MVAADFGDLVAVGVIAHCQREPDTDDHYNGKRIRETPKQICLDVNRNGAIMKFRAVRGTGVTVVPMVTELWIAKAYLATSQPYPKCRIEK
jgi:hypothetical protein